MSAFETIFFDPFFNVIGPYGYVFVLTLWGLSTGAVFVHAYSNGRNPVFWVLFSVILPLIGPIIYYIYFRLNVAHARKSRSDFRRGWTGDYFIKPRTVDDKLKMEAVGILANYRDIQIEELIMCNKLDDAMRLIEKRIAQLSAKGDITAVETLHYYKDVIIRFKGTKKFPEYLLGLWKPSESAHAAATDEGTMLIDDTGDWAKELIKEEPEERLVVEDESPPEDEPQPPRWLEV